MKLRAGIVLFAGIAALAMFDAPRHVAEGAARTTFCVERPISFDPMFRPSGCFTYEPIDGGILVIGHALLDSQYLPDDGTVEARVDGATCGRTTISGAEGVFVLPVAGGDSQAGCATAGQRVEFYISGVLANQTLLWPATPRGDPEFLPLTAVDDVAWYWFERAAAPPARVGTTVEAFTNGELCAQTMIGGEAQALGARERPNLRGFLRLIVSADNKGCGREGTLVEFRVGGLLAETALPWAPGVQRINLLVQGDANCDFQIDARDATLVLQVYVRLASAVACDGDADRDGDIDVFDARHILEFAAGISNALPL